MRTALDAPENELDRHERNFVANVKEHGWFATHVFEEGSLPGFAYSTGFYLKFGKPEFIIFSMKREIAHQVLWNVYNDFEKGNDFPANKITHELFEHTQAAIFSVAQKHHKEHFGWNTWFYAGEPFPASQIVWTDRANKFPWEPSFSNEFINLQPDLSEKGWLNELDAA